MIVIRRTDSSDPEFVDLATKLSEFLAVLNGEQNDFFAALNKVDTIPAIVASFGGVPVGCGAIRPVDGVVVEIKRMFVDPAFRGKDVGKGILAALESWAGELGFKATVLETSIRLPVALQLYQSAGYCVIPNYGAYVGVEQSVCMRKDLD